MPDKKINLAIIGQPNSGKTSLFNKLTGSTAQVGNWAGVTVEKKEGKLIIDKTKINVIDLPGIYSLSTLTLEEKITRNFLIGEKPDLVLNIIDSNNLERQLFLTIQLLFMNLPMILVCNMTDEVEDKGLFIDLDRLSELLGLKIVKTVARNSIGIEELKKEIIFGIENNIKNKSFKIPEDKDNIYKTLKIISEILKNKISSIHYPGWYALKFLENDIDVTGELLMLPDIVFNEIDDLRKNLMDNVKKDLSGLIPDWIYGITHGIQSEVLIKNKRENNSNTKEIVSNFFDLIILNKFLGVPVFFIIIFLLFQTTFLIGHFVIDYLTIGITFLEDMIKQINSPLVVSLLNNGIISGVGNVLLLVPYIFIMFFIMSLIEDSGYMARAAFVMDRFMHKIGLHGKSFIPLVMGFGCNVPAIMAARTLESHEERVKTILMIPFISCSARLPVFVLLSAAFFGKYGGLVVFLLYCIGITVSIVTGLILNKTYLTKKSEGLIMELPPYRLPHILNSITGTWPKIKHYFVKAGTVIFISSVVLWTLSYFPIGTEFGGEGSIISYIGKIFGLVLAPLGFDWKMSVGLVSGFLAKEVIISTLSVLYSSGGSLVNTLPQMINPVVGFSYLAFILIYVPCLPTIAVIKSETNSYKWAAFSVIYSIGFAWALSFLITTVGRLIFRIY